MTARTQMASNRGPSPSGLEKLSRFLHPEKGLERRWEHLMLLMGLDDEDGERSIQADRDNRAILRRR